MCVFMKMIKKYMFFPGKVENWIFIIDSCNKGLFEAPVSILISIIQLMQVNFASCLENLLILNPSSLLKWSWNLIEKVIDAEAA
jgi:hypothetical protein